MDCRDLARRRASRFCPAMTTEIKARTRIPAARKYPGFARKHRPHTRARRDPQEARGMPDARRTRSLVRKLKSTRVSHHRHAETFRHSLHDGFNGFLRTLLGDRALLPPSPVQCGTHYHELDASVGASGPHDFAVRGQHRSSRAPPRPSHSAPNVRDDREAPLLRAAERLRRNY